MLPTLLPLVAESRNFSIENLQISLDLNYLLNEKVVLPRKAQLVKKSIIAKLIKLPPKAIKWIPVSVQMNTYIVLPYLAIHCSKQCFIIMLEQATQNSKTHSWHSVLPLNSNPKKLEKHEMPKGKHLVKFHVWTQYFTTIYYNFIHFRSRNFDISVKVEIFGKD